MRRKDRKRKGAPYAPPCSSGSADPSRRAREDRELPQRRPEGSPGGGGGERDRRRGNAHEPVPEEGEKGARCRRARVQVSRVRQISKRISPPPRPSAVHRLAVRS